MEQEYVHMLEDPGSAYDWWMIGVRQEEDGSYTWAEESGCSCYWYEHLEPKALPATWAAFEGAVENHSADEVQKAEVLHDMKRRLSIFA